MTRQWGCPEEESAEAVSHFVREYDRVRYSCLRRETIVESFGLAERLGHDVFDCVYLAFALQENAKGIVTTDTDFEKLCEKVGLEYVNPVPKEVLKRFKERNT
jgi:predicted nucleic acid-binding protein